MIVVTGAAGFIGSAVVWKLNQEGINDILVVDQCIKAENSENLTRLAWSEYLHKDVFLQKILAKEYSSKDIDAIIHMGACSSTTETDYDYMMAINYAYTRHLAEWVLENNCPYIYASSAATYGDGSRGYSDHDEITPSLQPLNIYGESKQLLDEWILETGAFNKMVGIKFFNVYGPNEYHKESMRSVVNKAFYQVQETGKIKLFKSYRPEYSDGGQKRDFVYVKDCVDVISWFLKNPAITGIYNLGTGTARTWNDLANGVFAALDKPSNIEYVDMPEGLDKQYQYYTCAEMEKLREAGYSAPFTSLQDGIKDYVQNYLVKEDQYLK